MSIRPWLAAAALLLSPATAGAQSADQLVGLFIQGCLPFVGNPGALRDWARRNTVPEVPNPARSAFLHGAAGKVFDASAPGTKLVLVSSDDGLCSVATNRLTEASLRDALEAGLKTVGLRFRLVIERDDKQVDAIHDREYLATNSKVGWRILAAAVKGDTGGQAMLTAGPE